MNKFQIKLLKDKQKWEKYVLSRPEANFLQSYNWGEFQQALNKKFFPLAVFNQDNKQVAAAMVIKETAKRGDYLTVAGGPLLNWQSTEKKVLLKVILQELKKLAKKEGCWFVRIRPQCQQTEKIQKMVNELGLKQAPMHLTADLTLELDITPDEDEILMQMRKNTRYSVRKSKRDGIYTNLSQDPQQIQEFYDYQLYLAEKHDFVPFSYDFLHEQFKVFVQDDQVALLSSYNKQDKLLASAFVIFYNQQAIYHYGISTPDNDRQPGSYAVLWAAIQEAKKRDCHTFNFWGIAPEDDPEHRFAGVSIFKRGFGGKEVQYLPAHDLVVNSAYYLTRAFETLRKKVRKL